MEPPAPALSVIIAAYNRSQVLRHAIISVLNSRFADWELLVIGDACTDDTAETVAAFADPRIRFVNLAERCGDQSGPNNTGVSLARGRHIAFLNHDDIHLPGHLGACVAALDKGGADFVWSACALALPAADGRPCRFELSGVPPGGVYSPLVFYWASSWVMRRSFAVRVGPWEGHNKSYATPSQAWLFRAAKSGGSLQFLPVLGAIVVPAAYWPVSYARRDSPEHEHLSGAIADDPDFCRRVLEETAIGEASLRMARICAPPARTIAHVMLRPVIAALIAAGIHPLSPRFAIFRRKRGEQVRQHLKVTGANGPPAAPIRPIVRAPACAPEISAAEPSGSSACPAPPTAPAGRSGTIAIPAPAARDCPGLPAQRES